MNIMVGRVFVLFLLAIIPFFCKIMAQNIERVSFDRKDSTNGYYLAVVPQAKQIKGVLVLLTSFTAPEDLMPETKLHNVAFVNNLLMVVASTKQKLYADSGTVNRINTILKDVIKRYSADTSVFALAGYDEAGGIALRYTELAYEHTSLFPLQPKAVFCIDTPVDLFGLWHWSESQIKKNYWPGSVGDAHYYIDTMTKENGTIYNNAVRYGELSPFYRESDEPGNEQYLKNAAVRLYYDNDVEWQLKNRRNSLYDTKLPDGSELIKRLLLLGNNRAQFISSKQPGMRSNGVRHPNALSIVDETECIQWLKKCFGIFDVATWIPPYTLDLPRGWDLERFSLPADFARGMTVKGIEDLRFTPGWADTSSEQHWSYAYLWWLDNPTEITASNLQQNIQEYYTGLVGRNIISRNIPENRQVKTTVMIKKEKTVNKDIQTFTGSIRMLDYMTLKPVVLNVLIHVKQCSEGHTPVFVEVSPRSFKHPVWGEFDKIEKAFYCSTINSNERL
jgi:hypothetical protein